MNDLPSRSRRTPQLGIRQVGQEYQQRYSSRVRRARLSGGALLLAVATHVVLAVALVSRLIDQGSLFPIAQITSHLAASVCVLPFTCVLALMYAHSRADARHAADRLTELESLGGKPSGPRE